MANDTQHESPFHFSLDISDKDVSDNSELNALSLLSEHTSLSKQHIKLACKQGAVWLTKNKNQTRLRNATKPLKLGDNIEIYFNKHLLNTPLKKPTLLADEGEYSVWYKPYGLLSQGSQWGDFHSLLRYAEFNLLPQRPAFLVHRLDRDASGIMLIAHNKEVAAKFSSKFSARDICKHYHAIVEGDFLKGNSENLEVIELNDDIDGKEALSLVKALAYNEEKNISLLHVDLKTGRKHQIRQHLANFGFPIVGDTLYGSKSNANKERLQLCAVRLGFNYPNRKTFKEYRLNESLLLTFP